MSRLYGKMRPRLTGLPYLADRATRLGGLPHLSCKHDQIKMRDYMERRVTPPRRVTSPTWGPPPPCKQALTLWHNGHRATQLGRFTLWHNGRRAKQPGLMQARGVAHIFQGQ